MFDTQKVYQTIREPPTRPVAEFRVVRVYHNSPPIYLKHCLSLELLNLAENVEVYFQVDDCNGEYGLLTGNGTSGDSARMDMSDSNASIEHLAMWTSEGETARVRLSIERRTPTWAYVPPKPKKSYHWTQLEKAW